MRRSGLDLGMCVVADRLLSEVIADSPLAWDAMTLPGEEERTSYRTGVIGLRCPTDGLWPLPVVLHELGHVAAQTLMVGEPGRKRNPIRPLLSVSGTHSARREELWSDFFATFALGAAYPAVMLLSRFDPLDARSDQEFDDAPSSSATHPTVDKRAFVMLEALDRLDRSAGAQRRPYRRAHAFLAEAWRAQLSSVSAPPDLPAASEKKLHGLIERFWGMATTWLPAVRHRPGTGTSALRRHLVDGDRPPDASGLRVADVVATAWDLRCGADGAPAHPIVEARATALLAAMRTDADRP
jgi:hypothetical protein